MNILLYDMGSYSQSDLIEYLTSQGHHCKNVLYVLKDKAVDDFFSRQFSKQIESANWDFVMSTNYFPVLAKLCYKYNLKYVSWVYDSPIDASIIENFQYENSYIFVFDRFDAERLIRLGALNIYHIPLAINPKRAKLFKYPSDLLEKCSCDISFVGNFYESPLKSVMRCQSDYDKGYIDSIIQSQMHIYGYNFVSQAISDELISRINQTLIDAGTPIDNITRDSLTYNINCHITRTERLILCNLLGKEHSMNYYSAEKNDLLSHLFYGGTIQYHKHMPIVFRASKLNLNPTLKSIQSGIPLRALDILNYGGTLFSNYQPELAEYFIDGTDVIMYEDIEDALDKAAFYLKHDEIRNEITKKGHQKVINDFSYETITPRIFRTAGLI